jgi:hypothetical protein
MRLFPLERYPFALDLQGRIAEKMANPEIVVIDVLQDADWDKSSLKIEAVIHSD